MKIFLSWSGNKSHRIALIIQEWLQCINHSVQPYVSSENIDKGARWSTDIAKELEDTSFGILCVTKDNLNAPWLTFEAGALSKTIDKTFVCPFLFDLKKSEIIGPLIQFQSTTFEKEDIKKLIKTINKACGDSNSIGLERFDKIFDNWYPYLESELNKLKTEFESACNNHKEEMKQEITTEAILEEVLDLTRSQHRLITQPEELFPEKYFKDLLDKYLISNNPSIHIDFFKHDSYKELKELTQKCEELMSENIGNETVSTSRVFLLMNSIVKVVKYADNKWAKKIK
jgi:hypothetical protein